MHQGMVKYSTSEQGWKSHDVSRVAPARGETSGAFEALQGLSRKLGTLHGSENSGSSQAEWGATGLIPVHMGKNIYLVGTYHGSDSIEFNWKAPLASSLVVACSPDVTCSPFLPFTTALRTNINTIYLMNMS